MKKPRPKLVIVGLVALALGCVYMLTRPAPQPQGDYAAIVFLDCDQVAAVEFISFDGRFEQVAVRGNAMLIDLQLRMSHIAFERVQYVQNMRPCVFEMPEAN